MDACLGIPDAATTTTTSTGTFAGPITVVFTSLPSNVTVANPTGFTASGHPYITIDVADLTQDFPALRVRLDIINGLSPPDAPTTFLEGALQGLRVQTIAGAFDPTML